MFWNKLHGELVDVIEYLPTYRDVLVYRFPRYQNQIKFGAQLIVREGQGAIFVNEGKLADVFTPGTYTLETRNLPVLSTLQGWKYGFNSPFKAEVYFYTTLTILDQRWGTGQPVTMELPKFGLGEIRAYGQASYKIVEPEVFFRQVVGSSNFLTGAELRDYLRGLIVSQFSEALTTSHPAVEQLTGGLNALDDTLQSAINGKLAPLGFQLTQFLIESLSLPPALRDEIFEYSRLNNIDLSKLTQFKAANAIEDVARQPGSGGGSAAFGLEAGVGLAVAQQVIRALGNVGVKGGATIFAQDPIMEGAGQATVAPAAVPPPLGQSDGVSFHVAVDGKPVGPLDVAGLAKLLEQGKLGPQTLVWQPGMASWQAASAHPALMQLFRQEPPPLPR